MTAGLVLASVLGGFLAELRATGYLPEASDGLRGPERALPTTTLDGGVPGPQGASQPVYGPSEDGDPTSFWLTYGLPCDNWKGHPAAHQEEARRVFGFVPPFTWVATACGSKLCLTKEHLVILQPLKLGYPAGLCIYCGLGATQRDHLIPEPWSGPAVRPHVLTVPTCQECNISINDSFAFSEGQERVA